MKNSINILAGIMFICGVGLLVHQRFMCDVGWFKWEDLWHHESLAVICFASSISLLVGKYLHRGK